MSSSAKIGDKHRIKKIVCYPMGELIRAREEFKHKWSMSICHDPIVQSITDAYIRYPPNITLKNCTEYPFSNEDLHIPPAGYTMKRPCPLDSHNDNNNTILSTKKPRFSKSGFEKRCSNLTEKAVCSSSSTNRFINLQTDLLIQFVCDNCLFYCENKEEALKHLKIKSHISCSQYVKSNDTNDDKNETMNDTVWILRQARIVYNRHYQKTGWITHDVAIFCPNCNLLFPDKLTCAYHHQIQHPNHLAKYAYGKVFDVRKMFVDQFLTCQTCHRKFYLIKNLIKHWSGREMNNNCHVPFQSFPNTESQIVQMFCNTCHNTFDRIYCKARKSHKCASSIQTNKSTNDHPNSDCPNSTLSSCSAQQVDLDHFNHWIFGFVQFCLAHALSHVHNQSKHIAIADCSIEFRFVQIQPLNVENLPPYGYVNNHDLMLYCLKECRLLVTYLKHCRGERRHLEKQARKYLATLDMSVSTNSNDAL